MAHRRPTRDKELAAQLAILDPPDEASQSGPAGRHGKPFHKPGNEPRPRLSSAAGRPRRLIRQRDSAHPEKCRDVVEEPLRFSLEIIEIGNEHLIAAEAVEVPQEVEAVAPVVDELGHIPKCIVERPSERPMSNKVQVRGECPLGRLAEADHQLGVWKEFGNSISCDIAEEIVVTDFPNNLMLGVRGPKLPLVPAQPTVELPIKEVGVLRSG